MPTNRTALITGAGRNIGRAVAIGLAEDGFDIVINGSSDQTACERVAEAVRAFDLASDRRRAMKVQLAF